MQQLRPPVSLHAAWKQQLSPARGLQHGHPMARAATLTLVGWSTVVSCITQHLLGPGRAQHPEDVEQAHLQEGLVWLKGRAPQPQPFSMDGCEESQGPGHPKVHFQGCGCECTPHTTRGPALPGGLIPRHSPAPCPPPLHAALGLPGLAAGTGAGTELVAPGASSRTGAGGTGSPLATPARGRRSSERGAAASPLPGREPPQSEAAGAKQLRQHKSTVTAPERLSPGVRKNTS